jgi:hypothetical protein
MTLTTKILTFLGITAALAAIAIIIYQQHQLQSQQAQINTQLIAMQQLADGIARSSSQYATKDDLKAFADQNNLNLAAIQADMDKLGAQLAAINQTTINSVGQVANNVPSSSTSGSNPNPPPPTTPDPYGYLHNTQVLQLNEQFSDTTVPFGSVGFSAWQDKPWQYNIQPREYNLTTVVGVDDQQRETIYNKFSIKVAGKDYPVKITNAKTLQQVPTATFSFWNPRLFLTAGGGVNLTSLPVSGSANAGIALGIASYGQYKTSPTFSIAQVGIAYQSATNNVSVVVNPFNVNIGGVFPKGVVDNTYIGPSVQIDPSGHVFAGANVSVGF